MAKKVTGIVKLQIQAGKANPSPPVGPALGAHGINIVNFCKEYNARTEKQAGVIVPVIVTIYADGTFTFVTKTPPASELIKKALNIESGSAKPNTTKVGTLSREQLRDIAQTKMADLNAANIDSAMRMIEGTARSMGILVAAE